LHTDRMITEWQVFAFYIRTISILVARSLLPKTENRTKNLDNSL